MAVIDSKNATGTGSIEAEAILCTASDSTVGKRIFVNKGRDGGFQVLRAATAGGVVQSRGEFYYLTVAHIFESENRMHTPSLKTESPHFDIDFDGQSDTDDDENNDMQMTSQGSLTPQDSCSEGRPSPSDSSHDSMDVKMEDTRTDDMEIEHIPTVDTTRNDDPRLYVLWSASVSNGLNSLTCVNVHNAQPFGSLVSLEVLGDLDLTASDDSRPPLDAALVKIRNRKLHLVNEIPLSPEPGSPRLCSEKVAAIGSEDADVVSVTAYRGLLKGKLFAIPTYMRLPYKRAFQQVYAVHFRGSIEDGDCGSLVFNSSNGDLYGHIVAGSPGTGKAYIIPATQVFKYLTSRIGAEVTLPTRGSLVSLRQRDAGSIPVTTLRESSAGFGTTRGPTLLTGIPRCLSPGSSDIISMPSSRSRVRWQDEHYIETSGTPFGGTPFGGTERLKQHK